MITQNNQSTQLFNHNKYYPHVTTKLLSPSGVSKKNSNF